MRRSHGTWSVLGLFRKSKEASVEQSGGGEDRTRGSSGSTGLYQGGVGLGFDSKWAEKPLESSKQRHWDDQIGTLRSIRLSFREQTAGGARVPQRDQ